MGKDTVRFACHRCLHCCTEVVCLPTPWDVMRIARETGEDPRDFVEFLSPDEIADVPKSDPTWLKCRDERYLMALVRDESTGCYFLDQENRCCSIYESRPILCRLYPFKLEESSKGKFKGFSLHKNVGCPKNRDGIVDTKPLYELYLQDAEHQEDYNEMVAAFNASKPKKKSPEEFLDFFLAFEDRKTRSKEKKKKVS